MRHLETFWHGRWGWAGRGAGLGAAAITFVLAGCETDSFMDPSKTGRFEFEPTTIPVLDRIDVIEQKQDVWAQATPVMPEDLIPGELEYRLAPGDVVTVGVFELYRAGEWALATRRVDAAGMLRGQVLGEIQAAGLTAQQLEAKLVQLLGEKVMANAQVDVVVEQASGLRYTIYGFVAQPGMFNLQNADLRLIDALALVGGVPNSIEHIYVIRQVALSEDIKPSFERSPSADSVQTQPAAPPVDVEDLIKQLGPDPSTPRPGMLQQQTQPEIIDIDALEAGQTPPAQDTEVPPVEPAVESPTEPAPQPPPSAPPVDVDELEPVKTPAQPPVDVDDLRKTQPILPEQGADDSFIFVPERGEWVRVRREPGSPGSSVTGPAAESKSPEEIEAMTMVVERIIEVDYQRLLRGDSSQNLVIRPGDRIFVDGPPQGYVYVDGEIIRAGVYSMPNQGMLTLSRFVAAAGGLTPIAIPNRCDLTRKISRLREATIRVDLAAIRQRTEPDIVLKPDDHLIIGTSFIATPLAVFRNGFRVTYGFGIVVDRNFGNDVFGPPPGTFD